MSEANEFVLSKQADHECGGKMAVKIPETKGKVGVEGKLWKIVLSALGGKRGVTVL